MRLVSIAVILARHDALFLVEPLAGPRPLLRVARLFRRRGGTARPGERLAAAFQEIGPAFIKLGQMLATRADLLRRLGRIQEARTAYDKAIELAGNTAEIAFLSRRRDQLGQVPDDRSSGG